MKHAPDISIEETQNSAYPVKEEQQHTLEGTAEFLSTVAVQIKVRFN
jgi:hypothetical protein